MAAARHVVLSDLAYVIQRWRNVRELLNIERYLKVSQNAALEDDKNGVTGDPVFQKERKEYLDAIKNGQLAPSPPALNKDLRRKRH